MTKIKAIIIQTLKEFDQQVTFYDTCKQILNDTLSSVLNDFC